MDNGMAVLKDIPTSSKLKEVITISFRKGVKIFTFGPLNKGFPQLLSSPLGDIDQACSGRI